MCVCVEIETLSSIFWWFCCCCYCYCWLVIVPWDVDDDVYMNSYACTCGARVLLLVVVGDLCEAKCEKSELIWLMVCVPHRVPNEPANNQTMDETCIQMTSLTLVNAETLPHMIICCSPKKLKHCCATPNKHYYDKVMFISMIMKYGCSKRCSTFCKKRNEKRRCMETKAENVWPNIYEHRSWFKFDTSAHAHSSMVHLTYNSQFERASNLINLFRVKRKL